MKRGESFSISFHQGTVDFPYDLKIHVSKISDDNSSRHSYRFVALERDNQDNPNIQFIPAFFSALIYLRNNDANFSSLEFEYVLHDDSPKEEIYFERIVHADNPIFDSLLVTGYISPGQVVISSLSCPPQRDPELEELL